MASFRLLFLAIFAVSVCGYDLNTRQQYLPLQSYPYQNRYPVVYTTVPQVLTVPYSSYSYPANYVIRPTYYIPYSYQSKDTVQKVTYPVRGYTLPSNYGQIYSPSYPHQREVPQITTYPVVYTSQQHNVLPIQKTQGKTSYQTKDTEDSQKVNVPFGGYATEQENAFKRQQQTKEAKVTFPFRGYLEIPPRQEQAYPYQTKEAIQKIMYPTPGYTEASTNTRPYPQVYASRYPEGVYQTVGQEYPVNQEVDSKHLRPNKPVIHLKYDTVGRFSNQHVKEEVLNGRDSWGNVNDEDYERNTNKVDRNLI